MKFNSKLANTQTSIFAVMSQMALEHNAINLSQGFPDFAVAPELIDLVTYFMKKGVNQYAPMPGVAALRSAIAHKQLSTQGVAYDSDDEVTITAGATQALAAAVAALVHPGDEVIVFEPTYDAYVPLIQIQGGTAVPLELRGPAFLPDWAAVSAALTPKTRGIIINTPHNPCGSALTATDLEELALIAQKNNLYIISDEVYEHIVFDGVRHISLASHKNLRDRTLVISSFGKTFHATGWKCGYCLAPADLTWAFRQVHQFMVYAVNTPVQYAYAEYLKDPSNYLNIASLYQQKRDYILKELGASPFTFQPSKSTYFQLLDYSEFFKGTGLELVQKVVKEPGVALIPLEPFYRKYTAPKLLRICFAKTDKTLQAGVERLKRL